jgi:hypothetical protein
MVRVKGVWTVVACSAILLGCSRSMKMDGTWKGIIITDNKNGANLGVLLFQIALLQSGKTLNGNVTLEQGSGHFAGVDKNEPLKISSGVLLPTGEVSFIAESEFALGNIKILFKGRPATKEEIQKGAANKLPDGDFDYVRGTATASVSTFIGGETVPCSFTMNKPR